MINGHCIEAADQKVSSHIKKQLVMKKALIILFCLVGVCAIFAIYFAPSIVILSHRDINSVNIAHLRTIGSLIHEYKTANNGKMPESLDELKDLIEDDGSLLFLWKKSFDDTGVPWNYHVDDIKNVYVSSPGAVNGISLFLTKDGEVIKYESSGVGQTKY